MMVKNIVVAVDESEESMRACEWACKHLSAIEAGKVNETTDIQQQQQLYNLILIHVQSTDCSFSAGLAYILSNQVFEFLDLDAKRSTQMVLNRALKICDRYGVKAETHVVTGEAKERICEAVVKLGAHLLVVGSHGHGGFIRAIRGSVSDYYSRNSTCPVVVVSKKVISG